MKVRGHSDIQVYNFPVTQCDYTPSPLNTKGFRLQLDSYVRSEKIVWLESKCFIWIIQWNLNLDMIIFYLDCLKVDSYDYF